MSFAELEGDRVAGVLQVSSEQLRCLALIPPRRALRDLLRATEGRSARPWDQELATALQQQLDAEEEYAAAFKRGEAEMNASFLFQTVRRTVRALMAAKQHYDEERTTDIAEVPRQRSTTSTAWHEEGKESTTDVVDRRDARSPVVAPLMESLLTRADARRARQQRTASARARRTQDEGKPESASATGGGVGIGSPESRDASARGGTAASSVAGDGLPLEVMGDTIESLRDAMLGRFMTNYEQQMLREDYESNLTDKIRQSVAAERLLTEEVRKLKLKRDTDRNQLDDTISKLQAELDDAKARARREEENLRDSEKEQLARMQRNHGQPMEDLEREAESLRSSTKTLLEDDQEAAGKVRKKGNQNMLELGDLTREFDAEMMKRQQEEEQLRERIARLDELIGVLSGHFELIDQNRNAALREEEEAKRKKEEEEERFVKTCGPAAHRIQRWFRMRRRRR